MSRHTFGLNSRYEDLLSRYGADDAVVVQLKTELDKQQEEQVPAFVERRAKASSAKAHSRANWHPPFKASQDTSKNVFH
jgi:hypothetical protein